MKSYCKGYAATVREVRAAYDDWAAHGSGQKNRWRVEEEHGSADRLIEEISDEISGRRLHFAPMRSYISADGPKERTITVESVKQQVCDYIVVRALDGMIRARLGFWQYGSAHVRSSRELASQCQRWQHDARWWVHMDVRKCYQSIRTDMLRQLISRYVRSADVVYVTDAILTQHGESLALGSYLSLRMAQLVLSSGYHHIESLGKRRRGRWVPLVSHQCWYADDIWLMGTRKRDVQAAARSLELHLSGLGLSVHEWHVRPISEPMDIAGWVVRPDRITLRARSFLRASRSLRRYRQHPSISHAKTLVSHNGQFTQSDSRGFAERHDLKGAMASARKSISREARNERKGSVHEQARGCRGSGPAGMAQKGNRPERKA